jgi:hypothetical protein
MTLAVLLAAAESARPVGEDLRGIFGVSFVNEETRGAR